MNRPTLSTFRAQWPDEAMGICQGDAKVAQYCNDAQERLLMDPLAPDEGWYGGWITMNLVGSASNGTAYFTTPRDIARLVVMSACQNPVHIRNGFYEYLNYGSGLQPKTCASSCSSVYEAYERDSVVTFSNLLSTPQTIRIYTTDVRDIGKRVLLQGKDANGQTILTTDPGTGHSAPGEYVVIMSPFRDSVNTFSTITGIQKDETWGMVQLFQVDPTTGVETSLSVMEPTEASALYRRYMLTGIQNSSLCCTTSGVLTVTAQGRLDFIPVANETDYLTIPNVPALVEECMSIRFSKMDARNAADQVVLHHARALSLLNGQMDKYFGKTHTAVKVPLFGSDKLRRSFA